MYDANIVIVAETRTRLRMLMRVRPFYSVSAIFTLYTCRVLSFIESGTPAYYHAVPSILRLIDEVKSDFREALGISIRDAVHHFNLFPLCVRRDIAMLGNLHKIVLGIAPSPFYKLISRRVCNLRSYGFHNGIPFQDK